MSKKNTHSKELDFGAAIKEIIALNSPPTKSDFPLTLENYRKDKKRFMKEINKISKNEQSHTRL